MPKLGKQSYLVQLLAKKTKVKPDEILDILEALSEALAEAFFELEPGEKERVTFGFVVAYWKMTGLGPGIFFSPSPAFKRSAVEIKRKGESEYAVQMFNKMMQKSKERVAQRVANQHDLNNTESRRKQERTPELVAKYNEARKKLRDKRKLQKQALKSL